MNAAQTRQLERWAPWMLALVVVVVWQALCSALDVSEYIFPSPARIADQFVEFHSEILRHAWRTLWVTLVGFALAIVGAEWVLRLLPRGTHRWGDFVTPVELAQAMATGGLCQQSLIGLRYTPVLHRAHWCRSTAVNYLASYTARPATLAGSTPMRPPERQRGSDNSGH